MVRSGLDQPTRWRPFGARNSPGRSVQILLGGEHAAGGFGQPVDLGEEQFQLFVAELFQQISKPQPSYTLVNGCLAHHVPLFRGTKRHDTSRATNSDGSRATDTGEAFQGIYSYTCYRHRSEISLLNDEYDCRANTVAKASGRAISVGRADGAKCSGAIAPGRPRHRRPPISPENCPCTPPRPCGQFHLCALDHRKLRGNGRKLP